MEDILEEDDGFNFDINDNQFGAVNYAFIKLNIPWGWQEVVCSCPIPEYPSNLHQGNVSHRELSISSRKEMKDYAESFGNLDNKYGICSKCNKRARWQFLTCTVCGEYYDWFFYHHAIAGSIWRPEIPKGWAWAKRMCWNCIVKKDPATADDRPPQFLTAPRGNPQIDFDFSIDIN